MPPMNTVVAVVGPTSSGKTRLAVSIAQRHAGEVVSTDSRQVYRSMDIGTAKPTAEQRAGVPHHLLDLVESDGEFNLALFLRHARTVIEDIHARGRLPVLAGGTGQYVWGLLEGWRVPEAPPDLEFRARLEARAMAEGPRALHAELSVVDPAAARRIDPLNPRRVIRALEVYQASLQRGPLHAARVPPPWQQVIVGLTLKREALYDRINRRVDEMLEAGWLGEVRGLVARGYDSELPSMSGLGYRELAEHIRGEVSLEEAVERIKRKTRRYARQQHGWFRSGDERIRWFQASPDGHREAEAYVTRYVSGLDAAPPNHVQKLT